VPLLAAGPCPAGGWDFVWGRKRPGLSLCALMWVMHDLAQAGKTSIMARLLPPSIPLP